MARKLKDQFGPEVIARIAVTLPVDKTAFMAACLDGFEDLELMDRSRHVAAVMHDHLAKDPATAVQQVHAAIGRERASGMASFYYNPHAMFIGAYGLPAYTESMAAMHDLTKVFTAEFCIRPFIVRHPQTMAQLREWAGDPDEHVRRLVSEGTRPRLPWAARLPAFIADPTPVIELLQLLAGDPSDYVRRSVGNNLNDIAKDHPELALTVAAGWFPDHPDVVRRGLRNLIKAGDPAALSLLGYSASEATARAELPSTLEIGESLRLAVEVTGQGQALVDIVVHYARANGSTSRKVFKGGEVVLDPTAVIRRTISFAQLSTRRHYPGPHRIGVLINGREQELGVIDIHTA